MILVGYW